MGDKTFERCPRCGNPFEPGFALRAAGLQFMTAKKLQQFIARSEDLVDSGWRQLLPSWSEYFPSYLCRECKLYLVDFSISLDHSQAKAIAAEESETP